MIKPSRILGLPIKYVDMTGETYDGEFKDGTLAKEQYIKIHKDLGDEETKIILAHELIHYAFAKTGINSILHGYSNGTDALEEGIEAATVDEQLSEDDELLAEFYASQGEGE